jgi:hypothetical protein
LNQSPESRSIPSRAATLPFGSMVRKSGRPLSSPLFWSSAPNAGAVWTSPVPSVAVT